VNAPKGEATSQDGRIFQIRVAPESESAHIDAESRAGSENMQSRHSGLGRTAFFQNPPLWFETLSTVSLFGLLFIFPCFVRKSVSPSGENLQTMKEEP
jgi:hypothetical protein